MKRMCLFLLLSLFCLPSFAEATQYYVATTGSDSNNGTSVGTPFLTIQKCVDTVSNSGGDTCNVANGTYTDSDANGITVYIHSGHSGTTNNPNTLLSTNRLGAKITIPAPTAGSDWGIYVASNFWTIQGFEISGGGADSNTIPAIAIQTAVVNNVGIDGTRLIGNYIHDVGHVCEDGAQGVAGVYFDHPPNAFVEYNRIEKVGRKFNGEAGCSQSNPSGPSQLHHDDHGLYISGTTTSITIQHNEFVNDLMGWPIQFFGAGSTVTNCKVYNNTFTGANTVQSGQILIAANITTCDIADNVFDTPAVGAIAYNGTRTLSGVQIRYNLSTLAIQTNSGDGLICSQTGVTCSNNLTSTASGLRSSTDFSLATGSAAINAGVDVGIPYCGSAPEMGAWEVPVLTSVVVANATPTHALYTFCNPTSPIQRVNNPTITNKTISGTPTTSGNTIDVVVTAAFTNGESETTSFAAYDTKNSSFIGGTDNQGTMAVSAFAITNQVAGTSPTLTQTRCKVFEFNGDGNTAAVIPGFGENVNVTIPSPGAFALRCKVQVTTATQPPTAYSWQVSENGGAYAAVPADVFTSDVGFLTPTGLVTNISTRRLTTDQSTFVSGCILPNTTACSVGQMVANTETEIEGRFQVDTGLSNGTTFDFKIVAGGALLNTYTVVPRVTTGIPTAIFSTGAK